MENTETQQSLGIPLQYLTTDNTHYRTRENELRRFADQNYEYYLRYHDITGRFHDSNLNDDYLMNRMINEGISPNTPAIENIKVTRRQLQTTQNDPNLTYREEHQFYFEFDDNGQPK